MVKAVLSNSQGSTPGPPKINPIGLCQHTDTRSIPSKILNMCGAGLVARLLMRNVNMSCGASIAEMAEPHDGIPVAL
jgi:hypothetical protein